MIDMSEFDDNALPSRLFPIIKALAEAVNALEVSHGAGIPADAVIDESGLTWTLEVQYD